MIFIVFVTRDGIPATNTPPGKLQRPFVDGGTDGCSDEEAPTSGEDALFSEQLFRGILGALGIFGGANVWRGRGMV